MYIHRPTRSTICAVGDRSDQDRQQQRNHEASAYVAALANPRSEKPSWPITLSTTEAPSGPA